MTACDTAQRSVAFRKLDALGRGVEAFEEFFDEVGFDAACLAGGTT